LLRVHQALAFKIFNRNFLKFSFPSVGLQRAGPPLVKPLNSGTDSRRLLCSIVYCSRPVMHRTWPVMHSTNPLIWTVQARYLPVMYCTNPLLWTVIPVIRYYSFWAP
jgi:hypothetical protein